MFSDRFDPLELKRIRKESGYTQQALADKLGITRTTLSKIENDKGNAAATLEMNFIKAWWQVCHQKSSESAKKRFTQYITSFFGL
jgi:DNA-binding XRE family transcriptional regulator